MLVLRLYVLYHSTAKPTPSCSLSKNKIDKCGRHTLYPLHLSVVTVGLFTPCRSYEIITDNRINQSSDHGYSCFFKISLDVYVGIQ